jgi:hypothetical protein
MSIKILTPSGIDPANFRFVAQCLNYCTTAGHIKVKCKFEIEVEGGGSRFMYDE